MAQAIKSLSLGSKIKDTKGNVFVVVAHNHYSSNQVTLMHTNLNKSMSMNKTVTTEHYGLSEVHYYLNNSYLNTLQEEIKNKLVNTTIQYTDSISPNQSTTKSVTAKAFIPALKEVEDNTAYDPKSLKTMDYFYTKSFASCVGILNDSIWTRSETTGWNGSMNIPLYIAFETYDGAENVHIPIDSTWSAYVVPFMNVPSDLLITDNVTNGSYSFVFNEPPVIQTINNIQGNYGSGTNISYVAIDNDDTNLTHYISFNNGTSWNKITPSRSGNIYTYSHVFNDLSTYYCRIKVVDSANNETTSNVFTISVNALAPTVNIVSVIDKTITFKVNSVTSDISKVEVIINNSVTKTFTNGFNFNMVYQVDSSSLNVGKNSIQIKVTSKDSLTGHVNLEANKTKYNLPPVGAKIIVNGLEYVISKAVENGSMQTYTLTSSLINTVSTGDVIKVMQDSVKVFCSLSNLENQKTFREMTLVKSKKLKGDFEGYIEEKYELEGTGRYSTIRLNTERFSSSTQSDIRELQQYFDYLED